MAGGAFLQVDQAASPDQDVLWDLRKRREDADLDRRVGLRAGRHHPEAAEAGRIPLHIDAGLFGDSIRKSVDRIIDLANSRQFRTCDGL